MHLGWSVDVTQVQDHGVWMWAMFADPGLYDGLPMCISYLKSISNDSGLLLG